MSQITITLDDRHAERLGTLAEQTGIPAEQLAQAALEEWLDRSDAEFSFAAEYVLGKNAELYRRLA